MRSHPPGQGSSQELPFKGGTRTAPGDPRQAEIQRVHPSARPAAGKPGGSDRAEAFCCPPVEILLPSCCHAFQSKGHLSRSLKWEAGCQGRNQPERPVSPESGRPSGKRALRAATGIRRCGKSFLLFNLYFDWLIFRGSPPDQIITAALDDDRYLSCRDPSVLSETIRGQVRNREMYQVFLDEVQYAIRYEELRNPALQCSERPPAAAQCGHPCGREQLPAARRGRDD